MRGCPLMTKPYDVYAVAIRSVLPASAWCQKGQAGTSCTSVRSRAGLFLTQNSWPEHAKCLCMARGRQAQELLTIAQVDGVTDDDFEANFDVLVSVSRPEIRTC